MPDENKGIQDVLGAIARDATDLLRKECRLFLLETRKAVSEVYVAAFLAIGAIVFGFVALIFAGEALLEWLAVAFVSRALAALAVTAIMALLGAILALVSYRRFIGASFIPKKTLNALKATRSALFGGFSNEQ